MPAGRPRKKIDKAQFEKLCELQCTLPEFECFFECDNKTIEKWCKETYGINFSEVFRVKRGKGQISLRRKQFKLADSNAAMAIFLGKQYLGQKDRFEEDNKDAINKLDEILDNIKGNAEKGDS